MYDKVTCKIKDKVEVEKHYPGNFGAPGIERASRKKKTPEDVARQNRWRRIRELRRIIELNFGEGDWHVVLTCRPEDRPSKEDAGELIRYFRDKLRKEYKAQGWEMKYIITCEAGKRGAVHWHMIVNNEHNTYCDTAKLIRKLWEWGRPYFTAMDDTGDYSKLAEYIVKEWEEKREEGKTEEKLSYMRSRNLIKPEVKTEKVDARKWKKNPDIPKGWYLVEGSLVNGINKYTGLPYQHYTIRRKEDPDADGKHLRGHKHKGTKETTGKLHVHYDGADKCRDSGCRGQETAGRDNREPGNADSHRDGTEKNEKAKPYHPVDGM